MLGLEDSGVVGTDLRMCICQQEHIHDLYVIRTVRVLHFYANDCSSLVSIARFDIIIFLI